MRALYPIPASRVSLFPARGVCAHSVLRVPGAPVGGAALPGSAALTAFTGSCWR